MSWFPMLLYVFALGTAGAVLAVPFREIGKYYFSFHAALALVLAAVAVLVGRPWAGLEGGTPLTGVAMFGGFVFASLIFFENVLIRMVRSEIGKDVLLIPVLIGIPFLVIAAFARPDPGTGKALLLALHFLTSAAALGTALVAMTTGHWYLSNARLSFDILVRVTRMFVLAVAVRGVVVATYAAGRFAEYWALEDFDKLVMAVRAGAGIVLAMVLGLMSLSCARRKANQSATGILYVAVVFVLIGETISMYLTLGAGRPI